MISKLIELKRQHYRNQYPSMPEHTIPHPQYTDKTANGLTKCIIEYINLIGGQAERISSTGRYIDKRKTYVDVIGFTRQIGSGEWIKGSGTKGTADISATYNGRSIKIEVKIGKDRMSEAQHLYRESIEKAGGVYIIAKTFEQFYNDFSSLFSTDLSK
jgi:hypothetical protein